MFIPSLFLSYIFNLVVFWSLKNHLVLSLKKKCVFQLDTIGIWCVEARDTETHSGNQDLLHHEESFVVHVSCVRTEQQCSVGIEVKDLYCRRVCIYGLFQPIFISTVQVGSHSQAQALVWEQKIPLYEITAGMLALV